MPATKLRRVRPKSAEVLWTGPPRFLAEYHNVLNMVHFVYVLLSECDGTYYVGSTKNISARLKIHNKGGSHSTKGRRPWKVVYSESFSSRSKAVLRERFLKTGAGRQALKEILNFQ